MRNKLFSGKARFPEKMPSRTQLLKQLYSDIKSRLPDTWHLEIAVEVRNNGQVYDAVLTFCAPDGTQARVIVEFKAHLEPIAVPRVVGQLRLYGAGNANLLAASPYIGPRARELLVESGIGYADATGNLRLQIDRPAVFIETKGASTNPWTEKRPLHSLKGQASGRIVRTLCDFYPPYGIHELVERSKTSAGSVSRVVALLEEEALLARGPLGQVINVKWPLLIRRWTQDYSIVESNKVQTYLEPRGLEMLLTKLSENNLPYAVTGSLAAATVAPIAPSRLAAVYVEDADEAAELLALRKADRGANVLLIEPFDPVVVERTMQRQDIVYAAVSQVAADLLTSPGRAPQEGEELLHWMEENENVWRTK